AGAIVMVIKTNTTTSRRAGKRRGTANTALSTTIDLAKRKRCPTLLLRLGEIWRTRSFRRPKVFATKFASEYGTFVLLFHERSMKERAAGAIHQVARLSF